MKRGLIFIALLCFVFPSCASADAPVIFSCRADNDLFVLLQDQHVPLQRFDSPADAVAHAADSATVLILADDYPTHTVPLHDAFFDAAKAKHLHLFLEYPSQVPGLKFGAMQTTTWERCVVATDLFGEALPKMRILAAHDCHFLPTTASEPLLVVARVAGFDTAIYGLPKTASPLLFETNDHQWLIATTKLSNMITARYAPASEWATVWQTILKRLDPAWSDLHLKWTPLVRPYFSKLDPTPADLHRQTFARAAQFYIHSQLLVPASRQDEIIKLLQTSQGDVEINPPAADEPRGDGSCGIMEVFPAHIHYDGNQGRRIVIRNDCQGESAMVLALDGKLNHHQESRQISENLLHFMFEKSGMTGGPRGDPKSPAFGFLAWGDYSPAWMVANYSDDNARTILSAMLAEKTLGTEQWNKTLLRALLANLRSMGKLGFGPDRIDMPDITTRGWKAFADSTIVNYSAHFEGYIWACYLLAYQQTGHTEFLDRTVNAIRMTMEHYPKDWRWQDDIERARMLLPLAWLVRVQDTPEHRQWLKRIATDLIGFQDPCGAIQVHVGDHGAWHDAIAHSNEEYGTRETPLVQTNDDKVSDQLYTTGFAAIGLHEAFAATNDPLYQAAEKQLLDYLCRIQIHSEKFPYLDGGWTRAFDFGRWEFWASSADIGWGAWAVESGWGQSWISATIALQEQGTNFWDTTKSLNLRAEWSAVKAEMAQNDGSPPSAK
jgi:hypothetical protein